MTTTQPGQTATPDTDLSATLRVGSVQPSTAPDSLEHTLRPDATTQRGVTDERDADFILKGRLYKAVKCLSDNSGEAQVFLVEGDEGRMVLKVYYPNFVIKKTLMRIVQNFDFEMVVKVTDFGKT